MVQVDKNLILLPLSRIAFCILIITGSACCRDNFGLVTAGFKFQKTLNLYYENGLELGYTHDKLWNQRIQIRASYLSSRFGSALSSNALIQNYYQFSTGIHFRPQKLFDPFLQANLGYFHFDTEIELFDFLDNRSMVFALTCGMKLNFHPRVGGMYAGAGYNIIQDAGTLYPVFFNLGLLFNVFPGVIR